MANVVSDIGTFMQNVGAAWLMVSLNAGPMYVAITQTASALPFFVLALPAGAIGDIVDRRKLILFTEIWMVTVAAVLAAFTIGGLTSPLLLLLLTGMETDLKLVSNARRAAICVSTAGIALPFALGVTLGQFLPDSMLPRPDERLITSLFLGTALSVASVKIVATVVREMKFVRRKVGMTLLASAIIDDTVGWTIIAITSSLALHGTLDAAGRAQSLLGTGLFLAASITLGQRLVFTLIRWTND